MRKIDLHMHTCFCDGKDTPEDMILSAIAKGMEAVGVCIHSHTAFDESYCASPEGIREFLGQMKRLKKTYGEKIRIFAGLEQDLYSDTGPEGFDYLIGSVHYLKICENYYPVDHSAEVLGRIAEDHFGGDWIGLARAYFEETSSVLEVTGADLIGHLDLVTKFNEGNRFFDETDPGYLEAAEKCIDALIPCGKPFEINTGAMSRGYRTSPYPGSALCSRIIEKGGIFLLSSDAHKKEDLMYGFDRYASIPDDRAYESIVR